LVKTHSKELPAPLSLKKDNKYDVIFGKNTYGGTTTDIGLTEEERKTHMYIIGRTGSGKTTTLYAFLKKIQNPAIKIITIEDPIEYHLKGVSQTQVAPEKGYDFSDGLRSIVRQDPMLS